MRVDLRVYAIVDPETAGGHDLAALARQVVAGGATLIQLRDKVSDTRVMVARARAIKAAIGTVPLLINDRVDVALAAGAAGVHVGQEDMAVEDARRILRRSGIIGLSIKTVAQAAAAPLDLIDYVGSAACSARRRKRPRRSRSALRLEAHRRRISSSPSWIFDLRDCRHQ